ncbi:hypothetical protein HMPREF9372_3471 [Sporosarcina newyorkensis 2681]|uniref:Uncharacterized protein n=1 Tax=Sporosarcina newyorkensis 2681 TaxID=1027292 RepID=F9DXE0_9BACL|nr:hypothetical protein HMPREF9372_3471 [Sporosarcina newyorkensis 2681]
MISQLATLNELLYYVQACLSDIVTGGISCFLCDGSKKSGKPLTRIVYRRKMIAIV